MFPSSVLIKNMVSLAKLPSNSNSPNGSKSLNMSVPQFLHLQNVCTNIIHTSVFSCGLNELQCTNCLKAGLRHSKHYTSRMKMSCASRRDPIWVPCPKRFLYRLTFIFSNGLVWTINFVVTKYLKISYY